VRIVTFQSKLVFAFLQSVLVYWGLLIRDICSRPVLHTLSLTGKCLTLFTVLYE